jgi:hypothetical protein
MIGRRNADRRRWFHSGITRNGTRRGCERAGEPALLSALLAALLAALLSALLAALDAAEAPLAPEIEERVLAFLKKSKSARTWVEPE